MLNISDKYRVPQLLTRVATKQVYLRFNVAIFKKKDTIAAVEEGLYALWSHASSFFLNVAWLVGKIACYVSFT